MASVTIDDVEYDLDGLDAETKDTIASLRLVDGEIQRLKMTLAIYATARNSYAAELKQKLKKIPE